MKKIPLVLILLIAAVGFSTTLMRNKEFLRLTDLGFISLGTSQESFSVGINLTRSNEVITTIEKAALFGKKIRIKMKVKEESTVLRILLWQKLGVTMTYETKSFFPMKTEMYTLFSVFDFPCFLIDGRSEMNLLGMNFKSVSTTLNNRGFSYYIAGYKGTELGVFKIGNKFVFGLGETKRNTSAVVGLGWESSLPSVGFCYLLGTKLGDLSFGAILSETGVYPVFYTRFKLGGSKVSLMIGGDGVLLAVY